MFRIAMRQGKPPVPRRRPRAVSRSFLFAAAIVAVFAFFARSGFVAPAPLGRTRSLARGPRLALRAAAAAGETHGFRAEVGKVMNIIVNSLYSNKDVFLRELVSNAADACDKKRFVALTKTNTPVIDAMKIRIRADKEMRTLTIEDNGIGMTKAELVDNLGSIARSGTAEFVRALEDGEADVSLIGQFGVGFYSGFLVADKIEVFSRSFLDPPSDRRTHLWTSEQTSGTFTISEPTDVEFFSKDSGTKLVLHLKEEAQEYLDSARISELLKKYSEFVTFPIEVWKETEQYGQAWDEVQRTREHSKNVTMDWVVLNRMKPLWLRSPETVNESEYFDFYRSTFRAFDEPLATTHFKVEGQIEFRALLFVPTVVPFDLSRDMFSQSGHSMRLYVRRVFINDKFDDLIPRWLVFLRGVVDSEDLPLNVGREILQQSRTLKIIRNRIIRKVFDTLATLREKHPEKYDTLWKNYGRYFKVGLVEDFEHRDELKQIVQFYSSKSLDNQTSLQQYVERMKPGQDTIYFVTGEGKRAAEIAPAMEKMRALDYEVFYVVDPLDEICIQSIAEFDGKKLADINKVGLDFQKTDNQKREMENMEKEYEGVALWLKKKLGDRVQKVQVSQRLVNSPATLVQAEWGMSPMMQRYLRSQSSSDEQGSASSIGFRNQAILEINPNHTVIKQLRDRLRETPDSGAVEDIAMMVYETAALLGGYTIEDPHAFAGRVTKLMESRFGE